MSQHLVPYAGQTAQPHLTPEAKVGSWTDEREATCKRLWLEGHSASQVAEELGGGISRSAVLGKIHRWGLSGRGQPNTQVERRPRRTSPQPRRTFEGSDTWGPPRQPAEKPRVVQMVATPKPVNIVDHKSGCRFPLWDDYERPSLGQMMYCGDGIYEDSAYCEAHARICTPGLFVVKTRVRRAA